MKRKIIFIAFIFGLINYTYAGDKDSTALTDGIGLFYLKGNIGKLLPLSNSNPSVIKSDYNTYSIHAGIIGRNKKNSKLGLGVEYEYLKSRLINNDITLGTNEEYKFSGNFGKFIFQYTVFSKLNIEYNIGIGSISCLRPYFTIPANKSLNGKTIEEFPQEVSNNAFITGIGINYSLFDWLSVNTNCDYIGATFNYKNIIHSEDRFITNVYNPDFKMRAYFISLGLSLLIK
jgi:hypothetical protein